MYPSLNTRKFMSKEHSLRRGYPSAPANNPGASGTVAKHPTQHPPPLLQHFGHWRNAITYPSVMDLSLCPETGPIPVSSLPLAHWSANLSVSHHWNSMDMEWQLARKHFASNRRTSEEGCSRNVKEPPSDVTPTEKPSFIWLRLRKPSRIFVGVWLYGLGRERYAEIMKWQDLLKMHAYLVLINTHPIAQKGDMTFLLKT